MTPTVPGTKCSCEGGSGVGGGLFCSFGGFGFVCFFFPHDGKASGHKPKQALPGAPTPSAGFCPLCPLLLSGHRPAASRRGKPAATRGPGWEARPPQARGFKGQGVERRGGPREGPGCRGKTSIQHSSVASDLHPCFLFPSSLLEGLGGNQHFKGKTFPGLAWKDARSWFFPPV